MAISIVTGNDKTLYVYYTQNNDMKKTKKELCQNDQYTYPKYMFKKRYRELLSMAEDLGWNIILRERSKFPSYREKS